MKIQSSDIHGTSVRRSACRIYRKTVSRNCAGSKRNRRAYEGDAAGNGYCNAKARNVSDFRKEYKMLKSRLVNDYHHAQDAYLNIIVGNVYFMKFTRNPMNFVKKEARRDGRKL